MEAEDTQDSLAADERQSVVQDEQQSCVSRRDRSTPSPSAAAAVSPMGHLSRLETAFHWLCWTFGCLYSTYRLYAVIQRHPDALDKHSRPGWLGGLSVDHTDYGFEIQCKAMMPAYVIFMAIHLLLGCILRSMALNKKLPLFHVLLSAAFLCIVVGIRRYLLLLASALIMVAASRLRSRLLIWLLMVALLLNRRWLLQAVVGQNTTMDDFARYYITLLVQVWSLCRAVMFSCDQNERPPELMQHDNVVTFLGFLHYGPTLLGPLLSHTDYLSSLSSSSVPCSVSVRLRRLLMTMARLAGWLVLLEGSNHLIHYHALRFSPDEVRRT